MGKLYVNGKGPQLAQKNRKFAKTYNKVLNSTRWIANNEWCNQSVKPADSWDTQGRAYIAWIWTNKRSLLGEKQEFFTAKTFALLWQRTKGSRNCGRNIAMRHVKSIRWPIHITRWFQWFTGMLHWTGSTLLNHPTPFSQDFPAIELSGTTIPPYLEKFLKTLLSTDLYIPFLTYAWQSRAGCMGKSPKLSFRSPPGDLKYESSPRMSSK